MKLCLAGNYAPDIMDYVSSLPDKSINVLQSYIDYQNDTESTKKKLDIFIKKSSFFMMDSGAYSMIYGSKKVDLDVYVNGYIRTIKKYNIKNYIELDLYDIIGVKETEALRGKIESEVGRPCIPVFHKSLGKEYYFKLIEEYDYIAVGGIAISGRGGYNVSLFRKLTDLAKKHNCKVHGLGYTPVKNLHRTGFYSVDSTSWLSSIRFGAPINVFQNGEMKKYAKGDNKRVKKGVRLHQFKEWLKYQQYAERGFS